MRPTYETQETLSDEQIVASVLESQWKCELRKLHKFDAFDFACMTIDENGLPQVRGFIEFKRRNCSYNAYETIMVSASKRQQAISLLDATNCPTAFVVAYTDRLRFINLLEHPTRISIGGRYDRSDQADVEVMVHYDIGLMKDICPSPFLFVK